MPDEPGDRPAPRPPRRKRRSRAVTFNYPPATGPCDDQPALDPLSEGNLKGEGRPGAASNATVYCTVRLRGEAAACGDKPGAGVRGGGETAAWVDKPVAGERPLWDFPLGTLAGREVAAYSVSRAAGWHLVPPTVMRDGPFGPGMCQLWIDADADTDLVALARSRDQPELRDMAVFDAVVNNADRKIGHLLPVADGRLYGCDHGVCFGEEYKLRTVLWQWRGEKLPGRALTALAQLERELDGGSLATELEGLLSAAE